MTEERKLAIQMWQEIKNKLVSNPYLSDMGVCRLKLKLCARHKLHWRAQCWFCQYMPTCRLCPLHDCSVYKVACDSFFDEEARLRACDRIIAALKGEYKYDSGRIEENAGAVR